MCAFTNDVCVRRGTRVRASGRGGVFRGGYARVVRVGPPRTDDRLPNAAAAYTCVRRNVNTRADVVVGRCGGTMPSLPCTGGPREKSERKKRPAYDILFYNNSLPSRNRGASVHVDGYARIIRVRLVALPTVGGHLIVCGRECVCARSSGNLLITITHTHTRTCLHDITRCVCVCVYTPGALHTRGRRD